MKTITSRSCVVELTLDDDIYCLEISPLDSSRTFVLPIKDFKCINMLVDFLKYAKD